MATTLAPVKRTRRSYAAITLLVQFRTAITTAAAATWFHDEEEPEPVEVAPEPVMMPATAMHGTLEPGHVDPLTELPQRAQPATTGWTDVGTANLGVENRKRRRPRLRCLPWSGWRAALEVTVPELLTAVKRAVRMKSAKVLVKDQFVAEILPLFRSSSGMQIQHSVPVAGI